jgi:outer membrane protein assembly factor BamB
VLSSQTKKSRAPLLIYAAALWGAAALAPSGGLGARAADADRYWGQWRGPNATGVSKTADPPVEWSETKNVRWKVEIPGRGSASPVVWGDRVFVSTAVPVGAALGASHAPLGGVQPRVTHRYTVLAIDRKTGKTVWERVAAENVPHEATRADNGTWASSSPVTDGEHVIASFESGGLYAYDMQGAPVWQKDLGRKRMRNQFGEGSTPALYGTYLVVVWDHQGQSFIVALDKRTGNEIWRQNRAEIDTWATPLVVEVNGRPQVIAPAMKQITSYDLATGSVVWQSAGLTMNPIPSPVVENGLAILMSGFQGTSAKAIRLAEAKGDITGTPAVVWTYLRDTPYVPSPLLYDGVVYFLKTNNGLLTALDAATGAPHYQLQRLDAVPEVFASPVGAAGRVYIAGRDGTTIVLKHGKTFEQIGVNTLDDGFDASPALVDNDMFLRGYKYLYCLSAR